VPEPAELEALRADLRSDDLARRDAAFARITELMSDSVRAIVAEALQSDNPDVREAAEQLLLRLAEVTGDA
jgi:hypothetical protein